MKLKSCSSIYQSWQTSSSPPRNMRKLLAEDVGSLYWFKPDIVHSVENGHENRLDVFQTRDATTPLPTVIYINSGDGSSATRAAQY